MREGVGVHAALAYGLIEQGDYSNLPTFLQALLTGYGSDYTPYLLPENFPLEEFYPGVSAIVTQMAALLETSIFPTLQTISAGGQAPLPVSYGTLSGITSQAVAILNSLDQLATVPTLLEAEWGLMCDGLQALLLFPEAFSQ